MNNYDDDNDDYNDNDNDEEQEEDYDDYDADAYDAYNFVDDHDIIYHIIYHIRKYIICIKYCHNNLVHRVRNQAPCPES